MVIFKSSPDSTGFEDSWRGKGSWRAAEAWPSEGPDQDVGDVTPSVEVEFPGLKGSWRGVEAWFNEENPEEAFGESEANCIKRSKHFGIVITMG